MTGAHGGQKVLDPLGLELQVLVSCHMGSGNRTWILCRIQVFLTAKPALWPWDQVFKIPYVSQTMSHWVFRAWLIPVPPALLQMTAPYLFYGRIASHWAYVTHFLYPRIGWRALGCGNFSYCKWTSSLHLHLGCFHVFLYVCLETGSHYGCQFEFAMLPRLASNSWSRLCLKAWDQKHVTPCLAPAFHSNCQYCHHCRGNRLFFDILDCWVIEHI